MEFISVIFKENRIVQLSIDEEIPDSIKIMAGDIESITDLKDYFRAYELVNNKLVFNQSDKETIIKESNEHKLRNRRKNLLKAYDVWAGNVAVGIEECKQDILAWKQAILDLNEDAIYNVPPNINHYLQY